MMPIRQGRKNRWYHALFAFLVAATGIAVLPAANVSAATAGTPWPSAPDRQTYNQAPASANVCPVAVVSTSGPVTGAANLLCGGTGGTTLTRSAGGATPTVVLDYGRNVGGIPFFTVTSASGSPQLKAGYAESKRYLTADGGEDPPWAEGDPARADTYPVTGPGTITNRFTQGGERYEQITLTSAGSVTLGALRDSIAFEQAVAAVEPLALRADPRYVRPLGIVRPGGRLRSQYRGQLLASGEVAHPGLLHAGEAVCSPSPSHGRGTTTSLMQARNLLELVDTGLPP